MAVAARLITQQINGKVQEYIQQTLRTQARQASNRLTERSKKIPADQRFAGIFRRYIASYEHEQYANALNL